MVLVVHGAKEQQRGRQKRASDAPIHSLTAAFRCHAEGVRRELRFGAAGLGRIMLILETSQPLRREVSAAPLRDRPCASWPVTGGAAVSRPDGSYTHRTDDRRSGPLPGAPINVL
jgi:hypothetical protein